MQPIVPPLEQLSDDALLEIAQDPGNSQRGAAYAALYERYRKELYSFCRFTFSTTYRGAATDPSSDAEDAVQDVFCRLGEKLHGHASPISNIKGWLYRTARNVCSEIARKARPYWSLESMPALPPSPSSDAPDALASPALQCFVRSLKRCRPVVYRALVLTFHGHKQNKVADILEVHPSTINTWKFSWQCYFHHKINGMSIAEVARIREANDQKVGGAIRQAENWLKQAAKC